MTWLVVVGETVDVHASEGAARKAWDEADAEGRTVYLAVVLDERSER